MATFDLYWSPEGRKIATVKADTARLACRKAPQPYRRFLGEVYAEPAPWRPKLGDAVLYLDGYDGTWKRGEVWSYTGEDRVYVNHPNGSRGEYRLRELKNPNA